MKRFKIILLVIALPLLQAVPCSLCAQDRLIEKWKDKEGVVYQTENGASALYVSADECGSEYRKFADNLARHVKKLKKNGFEPLADFALEGYVLNTYLHKLKHSQTGNVIGCMQDEEEKKMIYISIEGVDLNAPYSQIASFSFGRNDDAVNEKIRDLMYSHMTKLKSQMEITDEEWTDLFVVIDGKVHGELHDISQVLDYSRRQNNRIKQCNVVRSDAFRDKYPDNDKPVVLIMETE